MPLTLNECDTGLPVTIGPITKFQEKMKGGVPPVTVAANVTLWPTVGDAGLKLKSTPEKAAGATIFAP